MATRHDFVCDQGATFIASMTYLSTDGTPVDLTGYTARMSIRKTVEDAEEIFQASTTNGHITLGGVAGTVNINIAANHTSEFPAGDWLYDLELVTGATVIRLVQGCFIVDPEITR